MPKWVVFYLLFLLVGGIFSIYYYRYRGKVFIIGESFSLLFTLVLFFYYYKLYPKPESVLVPIGMFVYILYWELIENKDILIEELKKENISKDESIVMILILVVFLSPLFYITGNLIANY